MAKNAITYRYNDTAREITTPIYVSMPDKKAVEFVAVWDTGATSSVITSSVAKQLNLCSEGSTVINGVTGSQQRHLCNILYRSNRL
ncbi:MAG: hypothetical protein LBH25_05965 [Fibromonadaceae bacterium]|jgi:hypothetical protein|nr:hypothetical protein [Fibromonadaceae bacterium]